MLRVGAALTAPTEYIQNFDSNITVNVDGSMDVIENIVYVNENIRNKHGIFRTFPTRYVGTGGTNYTVRFAVTDILRNGKREPYTIEDLYEGKNIRIGSADSFIEPGTHTYTIKYHTDRQLGFFKEYDMLYWNVTGNGWPWYIMQASASVQLPKGINAQDIVVHGYTGRLGSSAKNYTAAVDAQGVAHFATTSPLRPHEGFTLETTWPKGFTQEPPSNQKTI